jgi:hypothetical protein
LHKQRTCTACQKTFCPWPQSLKKKKYFFLHQFIESFTTDKKMSTPAMRAFLESEKVNMKKTIVFSGYYRDKNATTNFLYCNTEMGLKGKKTAFIFRLMQHEFVCL